MDSSESALASRRGHPTLTCAHRGASATRPENTAAAFAGAVPMADYVETDVRHTADGAAILVHDDTLRRTTDVAEVFPDRADDPVGSFTLGEIARLDAGSWFGSDHRGESVLTLRDGLDLLAGTPCGMLLELKTPVVELVQADVGRFLADHPGFPIVIGSVRPELAAGVAEAMPGVAAGVLFVDQERLTDQVITSYARFARFLGFRNDWVTPETVSRVHAAGMQILHNTNTASAMIDCAGHGADGTVTDRPELKAALVAGGSIMIIEAQDLTTQVAGTATVDAKTGAELDRLPFKLSGHAALVITAASPGEWCDLRIPIDEAADVECSIVTGPAAGSYDLIWDGHAIGRVDGCTRSPARCDLRLPAVEAGDHCLRLVSVDPGSLVIDLIGVYPTRPPTTAGP